MAKEFSVEQFFKELREVENSVTRAMLRFHFELASDIRNKTQDNIKATFGAGKGYKSEITKRGYGSSGRRQGRGGGLMNSVMIERTSDGMLMVTAGGRGVPARSSLNSLAKSRPPTLRGFGGGGGGAC